MRKRKPGHQLVIFLKHTSAHPIENKKSGDDAKGVVDLRHFRLSESEFASWKLDQFILHEQDPN